MNIAEENFPEPLFKKNDRKAKLLIWIISIIVFIAVSFLANEKFNIKPGFNPHIFASINAFINTCVTILLIAALWAVKNKKFHLHESLMLAAIFLSLLFLLSYICHHLLSGETKFGDINHDHILSNDEKLRVGASRYIYYILLATHIPLAAIVLPFILFTAYRSLTGDYLKHKKLARITWPVWLYVAISGVIVYFMIRPYYT